MKINKQKKVTINLIVSVFFVLALVTPKINAHTQCRLNLGWGNWTEACPHSHAPIARAIGTACNRCIAGWALIVGGAAAYMAATGGIGTVALQNWVITQYGVSSTVAHSIAAGLTAGVPAGAIASGLCPSC